MSDVFTTYLRRVAGNLTARGDARRATTLVRAADVLESMPERRITRGRGLSASTIALVSGGGGIITDAGKRDMKKGGKGGKKGGKGKGY